MRAELQDRLDDVGMLLPECYPWHGAGDAPNGRGVVVGA
jgi:hypothetical protein